MKPLDNQLDRLLKAAAAAPRSASTEPPFGLETRVIANWRALHGPGNDFLEAWFRRAALCSCILAIAGLGWTFYERSNPAGGEMAVADSAMSMGVEP